MPLEISWRGGTPLGEDGLRETEIRLGVIFPPDFRKTALTSNGAVPNRTSFVYQHPRTGRQRQDSLAHLLSLRPRDEENVFEIMRGLAIDDQLPLGVIPIGGNGGGNFIGLDYRQGYPPSVVLWRHEEDAPESVVAVARSFDEFLDMLRTPDDDE
jgi:hypothetical protein